MKYKITWNEKRVLRKIAKRIVCQSHAHTGNIETFYSILAEEAKKEFTEDNNTTLDNFLLEHHRKASERVLKHTTLKPSF